VEVLVSSDKIGMETPVVEADAAELVACVVVEEDVTLSGSPPTLMGGMIVVPA
jgi:hypothetical protein